MISRTIPQVHALIVDYADIGGQDDRHPPLTVKGWANDSYRGVRTWSVTKGFRDFITPGTVLPLPTAPETNETYGVVPLPATALSLQGVDVLASGRWYSLEQVDWEDRRRLQNTVQGNRPLRFAVRNRALQPTATSVTAGDIALFPFGNSGSYRLFTLEEWVTTVGDTDLMIFPSQAWLDAVCYEAALKAVALKDGDNTKRASWLKAQLDDARMNILATIPKLTMTGPKTMRRDANYRGGGWSA